MIKTIYNIIDLAVIFVKFISEPTEVGSDDHINFYKFNINKHQDRFFFTDYEA